MKRSRSSRRDDRDGTSKANPRKLTVSGRPRASVSYGTLIEPPERDQKRQRAELPYYFFVSVKKGSVPKFKRFMKTIKHAYYGRMY